MGWMVRGSNPVGGEIFRTCPDRPCSPPSLLYNGYRVFPGGKQRPGRDADLSPPSSAVGHERVELYLYSRYGSYGLYIASVPVQGGTLPLPYLTINLERKRKPVKDLKISVLGLMLDVGILFYRTRMLTFRRKCSVYVSTLEFCLYK